MTVKFDFHATSSNGGKMRMRMADLAENQRRFANQYTKWDTLSPWSQYNMHMYLLGYGIW